MENQTRVTSFILLGFPGNSSVQIFLFFIFALIYVITLVGNMMIMVAINVNHLHSPMHFFLSHLSFLDICFSSITVPKVLMNWTISQTISYKSCITQMFFILLTACTEVFLLAAMAYDRYAAICKPLHYVQIMNKAFCRWLVGGAWTMGFFYALINTFPVLKLAFCGPNIIRHFSCELPSLLALSCTETFLNQITYLIACCSVSAYSIIVILVSYTYIISTILKLNSTEAKRKTFSTCSSHLMIVILYYSTGFFRYLRPSSASSVIIDELFSVQYNISTPMLNPLIYSLKTREVKEAIKKLMGYKSLISHMV
ncbi:olfactory receptor 5BS1-like [Liasis olivaceus]